MRFITVGGVVLLLLAVAKGLSPTVFHFLPLGGSTVAEMGIVFGLDVAVATVDDLRRSRSE